MPVTRGLTLRTAGVHDAEALATLFSEFNQVLGADGLPDALAFLPKHVLVTTEQMAWRLERIAGVEHVLLASVGEEPAGLAGLRLVPYIGQDVPYAELTQLYVRERHQRRGVGAALIAEVERIARAAGATCVHVITGRTNGGAQAFYRAQGYSAPGLELEKHFLSEGANA